MILVRAPLRVSLGGGGTDLPGYFEKNNGFVVSAAIDKFITIVINENLKNRFEIKYSKYENVKKVDNIKHNIIRECLKLLNIKQGMEISSFSDVPHGTGLGSSGSFTVCLLKGLFFFKNIKISNKELALKAFHVERNILKQPVGYQDQLTAACGGLLLQEYSKNKIYVKNLKINRTFKKNFDSRLILIYSGITRFSKKILKRQDSLSKQNNKKIVSSLDEIKKNSYEIYENSIKNNLKDYGKYLDLYWNIKIKIDKKIANKKINQIIKICKKNNVDGCRVVGAGAGGYILAHSKNFKKLKNKLIKNNILFLQIKIEEKGVSIIDSYNKK